MKIQLFPPLDKILTPSKQLDVPGPISVADLLRILQEEAPRFARYGGFGHGDTQPRGLLVWRDRELLTLKDMLAPDDEVEMIAMVAGG